MTHGEIDRRVSARLARNIPAVAAVQRWIRNRLRRLYREAFRLTKHDMPVGLDLVVIPRKAEEPAFAELKRSLPRLVQQVARKLGRETGS